MGGEQYPVLVYGPKIVYECEKWIFDIFKIIDKKEYVIKNSPEDISGNEIDEDDIIDIFEDIFDGCYYSILNDFLSEHSLVNVYNDNCDWEYASIGIHVPDYNTFSEDDKKKVDNFCIRYKLPTPTFYAGISGEFE